MALTPITPDTKVLALAAHPLLDQLSGNELAVYLRIIAAGGRQRTRRARITNAELFRDAQTASRILRRLAEKDLITISIDGDDRTIEVRR